MRLSQEEHDLRATVTALAACHEKEAKAKIALEDVQEAQPDSVRAIVFFFIEVVFPFFDNTCNCTSSSFHFYIFFSLTTGP